MANPQATFASLKVVSADFILTHGAAPSVCRLVCEEDGLGATVGTLELTDEDGVSVTFADCAVERAVVMPNTAMRGARLVLDVVDRRWRWRGVVTSGRYNIVTPDGAVAAGTRATVSALVTKLLGELGESGATVSLPDPDAVTPPVEWHAYPAAEALEWVCRHAGATLALGYDDKVRIEPANGGPAYNLPIGNERHELRDIVPATLPQKITAHAGPTACTTGIYLEAVCMDIDGVLRRPEDLTINTYRSIDWDHTWPGTLKTGAPFHGYGEEAAVDLINQTLYRIYRIYAFTSDGSLVEPNLAVRVASMRDILPLLPRLDLPDGTPGTYARMPTVGGKWWEPPYFNYGNGKLEQPFRIHAGCRVDTDEGVVYLDEPLFNVTVDPFDTTVSVISPATLQLFCSYYVRGTMSGGLEHETRDAWNATGTPGVVGHIVRPEKFRSAVFDYSWNWRADGPPNPRDVLTVRDNLDKALVAAEANTLAAPMSQMEWTGIKQIHPSGHLRQVRWVCGEGFHTATWASRNTAMRHAVLDRDKAIAAIDLHSSTINPAVLSGGGG